jgi:nucleoside-diphosphate-sugar epimerase
MIKILVTGGAGNIASALIAQLAANPANHIVIADNLLTGEMSKVPTDKHNVQFIKCDVNDYNDIAPLFFANNFEYVFHFAAVVGVQRTLKNPLWVMHDIHGIEHVLNLSKNTGVRRIYYSSSSEVYGEPFEIPQNEHTTPLNSRLPYAIVKNVGEAFLRTYHREFGLNYQIFRFFNTYGPNQSEDFVVPRFIRQAMANEDITIYGDGSQTRTFCYVDDNVEACVNAHHTGLFENDTINIGSDAEFTIKELAETIIDITGSSSKLINLPALTEGDMTRRKPDIGKMRQLLNHDLVPLEEGIRRLVQHFEETDS